jgi:hypothetical protein
MVDLFHKLLGHRWLRALVLAIVATALVLPAQAEASDRSGGVSPDAAPAAGLSVHPAVAHPAVAHPVVAHRASRPARANADARPAIATPRTVSADPAAAPAAPPSGQPSPAPDAWPGRHQAKAEPVANPSSAPAVARRAFHRRFPRAGEFAPTRTSTPAVRPWHPVRPHGGAVRHQIVATRVDREPVEAVAPASAAAPHSHPRSGPLPPAGAGGTVSGVGAGAPAASAAALLGLTALALLWVLLPGLLALDALPVRSAFFALRPERPG